MFNSGTFNYIAKTEESRFQDSVYIYRKIARLRVLDNPNL